LLSRPKVSRPTMASTVRTAMEERTLTERRRLEAGRPRRLPAGHRIDAART
jgi:hypothetical protein